MRRIATHKLIGPHTAEILSHQVIELDDEGVVCGLFSFEKEISHTEWLPGLIILSAYPVSRNSGESFLCWKERIELEYSSETSSSVLRAYWVTPFNVSAMEFLPDSRIVPLK
ncbi:hypothetical protein [uncultured Bacteroides sp.]|uniref:hypothetical protein n=1 Tax=uncultured Bacteroides sp. TaxID=162156 RepID=UPI00261D667D|nr:hypothetical protein [uncultured Bacteroides sp.]